MEDLIITIKRNIKNRSYRSEEAVRSQICYPILQELGWKMHSTDQVVPEYKINKLRVDLALCHSPKKPGVFIEVKALGTLNKRSAQGEEQIFDYAARKGGVPMIILTDGNEWHFYNTHGEGDYDERQVKSFKLGDDLLNSCIGP